MKLNSVKIKKIRNQQTCGRWGANTNFDMIEGGEGGEEGGWSVEVEELFNPKKEEDLIGGWEG